MSDGVDIWIAAGPWPQRPAMRVLLAVGRRPRGAAALRKLGPLGQFAGSLAAMERFDDPATARALGWDAAAVVARGRALRQAEGRP